MSGQHSSTAVLEPQAAQTSRPWVHPAAALAVAVVGLLAAVLIAFDASGPVRGVSVGAAMLLVPGLALLPAAARGWGRAARFCWVVVMSITPLALLALVMGWTAVWVPRIALVVALLAGVAAVLVRTRRDPASSAAGVLPRSWAWRDHVLPGGALLVAGVLWAVSVATADVDDLGPWGLTPQLGLGFALALVLILVVLGAAPFSRVREGWVAAHLGLFVLALYGTPALVEDTPRLPWAFKHIAVTRYISEYGHIDTHGDIYQRWPGMFAWTALVADGTGYGNPVHWQYLAEIGFALLNVVLVVAIARAFAPGSRWAWGAGTLYAASNWVAQNYFAPQGLAYVLVLFVALLLVLHLGAAPFRPVLRLEGWLGARRGEPGWPVTTAPRPGPAVLVALLSTFALVVATHQLSPYMALLMFGPLFVLGYLRPFWVAIAMGVTTLGFLAPNFTWVDQKYGLLSSLNFVDNATYQVVNVAALSPAATWQRRGTLVLAGIVLLLAVAGIVRRLLTRHPREALVVGWLFVAPFAVMVAQSYGGEVRLRSYLFALPWASIALAWLFAPRAVRAAQGSRRGTRSGPPRVARWTYPTLVVLLTGLFVATYFQPAATNRTSVDAVAALEWTDQNAQPGDVVLTTGASPASIGARYTVPSYASLAEAKLWVSHELTADDVLALAHLADPDAKRILLLVSDEVLDDPYPTPFVVGELRAVYDDMLATPTGRVLKQIGDVQIVAVDLDERG